jgi:mono/diheme cytochrome c family protein/uncharacterized membrane protein SirB2
MPITAVLHTHVLVVILFLILFIVKAFLLFLNKHQTLQKVRNNTKILDIVFGVLILVTGGYLLFMYNGVPAWLWVKVALVLAAIPLGIIGLKKHNKMLTALTVVIFIYVYGVAETNSLKMKPDTAEFSGSHVSEDDMKYETQPPVSTSVATPGSDEAVNKLGGSSGRDILEANTEASLANAQAIYTRLCETCHGPDGRKGTAGARDLSKSPLSQQQQKNVIANGRGLMQPFKDKLTDQEMEALAAYTTSFKNNR